MKIPFAIEVPVYATNVQIPVLCGWLHPVILVPLDYCEWNDGKKRAAILHELQHVARADNWTFLIAIAAHALYWFHPLVWWMSAQMQRQQELACDERVLASGIGSSEYASLLVEAAARLTSSNLIACTMISHKGQLRDRIEHILSFSQSPRLAYRNYVAVCAGTFLMLIAGAVVPARELPRMVAQEAIYRGGDGVTSPLVIRKIEPQYSPLARQRKIQGNVLLSLIIDAGGKPINVSVEKPLDWGLDRNAVDAISQWQFHPAMKAGKPVAMRVNVDVNFRLK